MRASGGPVRAAALSRRALVLALGMLACTAAPAAAAPMPAANVNLSAAGGNQVEGAIAVDPHNPSRVYAVAMNAAPAGGLVAARSGDGGATWTRGTVTGSEGLPLAAADPSLSWDSFGNLFLSYINLSKTKPAQILAISSDGGATFKFLTALATQPDQPTVTTGPGATPGSGSVWVSWKGSLGFMWVAGAPVTGLGTVGAFQPAQGIEGTQGLSFGDISVGPSGQVMVSVGPETGITGGAIYTATSPGLGSPFTAAQLAAATGVGGFEPIPAQPGRGIDSESGLAYDRSGGSHAGRVYLMYTDATPPGSPSTRILLRHSDDNGASWSAPVQVNDDIGGASHFLPRIALDQGTGAIGVTWHDTRNDPLNVSTQLWGAFSTDGGASFAPNIQISAGSSNEAGGDPPPAGYPDLDYGDYTGSSFAGGMLFPIWADNSNSTGDNPSGSLKAFDVYTAAVPAPAAPASPPQVAASFPPPQASGWYTTSPVLGTLTASATGPEPSPITELACTGASVGAITGLGSTSASATISVSQQGESSVSCTARNAASLGATSTAVTVRLDSAAPELAPTITPASVPILLNAPASAAPNATDPLSGGFASGIASASCAAPDTTVAGAKTIACAAADLAGNTATLEVPYVVGYGISALHPLPGRGFFSSRPIPVSMRLTESGGGPISSALARTLGCTVTAAFAGGPPACMSYRANRRTFTARVSVPAGLTPRSSYPLVVSVSVAGATVAEATVLERLVR